MSYDPYYSGCLHCRLCEGAAYQLPPFLFAGSPTPQVLVIGQNPGEIGDKEKWRLEILKVLSNPSASAAKALYELDFITSYGHSQMAKIFGKDWIVNGKFMFTNAVRCRTPGNAPPSEQMISNCASWTSQLALPPVVVLMGKVAMRQFCSSVKKPEVASWTIVKLKQRELTVHVVTIPHYAAMKSSDDLDRAKELFETAARKAGVDD